jgi:hypothetical protein
MNHPSYAKDDGAERIVYIRAVGADELPPEAREQVGHAPVYAMHDETGARLALFGDRALAFVVARQNAMIPVSVH